MRLTTSRSEGVGDVEWIDWGGIEEKGIDGARSRGIGREWLEHRAEVDHSTCETQKVKGEIQIEVRESSQSDPGDVIVDAV